MFLVFLGVEVTHTSEDLYMCHSKYIQELLDQVHLHKSKELENATQFQNAIRALQYYTLT